MIHDYDTHFWLAWSRVHGLLSAHDMSTADPRFVDVKKIRLEPFGGSLQAVLEAEIPEGYVPIIRTDLDRAMNGALLGVHYVWAVEKGDWLPIESGRMSLHRIPLVDGFRAEIFTWSIDPAARERVGEVDFNGTPGWKWAKTRENGCDVYRFFKE